MSANNELYIKFGKAVYTVFDRDVDNDADGIEIGWASTLERAVKIANKYMETNEVEYGLNIELSKEKEGVE